jgi:hypothetical protein
MNRELMVSRVKEHSGPWGIVVIGGGEGRRGVSRWAVRRQAVAHSFDRDGRRA